jgi:tripartite-type tricarboxylate transporter receptor subunit TctC
MKHEIQNLTRRSALTCMIGMVAGTAASGAMAQTAPWPEKPIRIIVPFAPGGATDLVARLVGTEMAKDLGQPVIVENKAGAAGNLGADAVAKSPADGYTLLWGTIGTLAINQLVSKKLPYDAQKDLKPISMVASFPNVLVVPLSSSARSVADLVALGKAKGLTYASSGVGTSLHLSGVMLAEASGLSMTHVPYKGSSQAMTDVVGGQVDMIFDNLPSSYSMVKGGKVRPLAVTGAKRAALLPDVPTMGELGFKNFAIDSWSGLLAPAGTPDTVIRKLDAAVKKAIMAPGFEARLIQTGAERSYKDPAGFAQYIQSDHARWRTLIQAHQISVD